MLWSNCNKFRFLLIVICEIIVYTERWHCYLLQRLLNKILLDFKLFKINYWLTHFFSHVRIPILYNTWTIVKKFRCNQSKFVSCSSRKTATLLYNSRSPNYSKGVIENNIIDTLLRCITKVFHFLLQNLFMDKCLLLLNKTLATKI